jgi:hypothetical protein
MQTNQEQKQREIDMAWKNQKNPSGIRTPTERELWEREERRFNKGKT